MNFLKKLQLRYSLGNAVKEALDHLPSAVCYFNRFGAVKLCNTAMYERYRMLAQSELQSLSELTAALEACDRTTGVIRDGNIFLFPDGCAMQYSQKQITTSEGRTYTECSFTIVTKLYEKRRELQRQSGEMKKMYGELKALSGRLLEVTREQEILNMKSLLHDQMNMGITAIRQTLRQNTASEENAAAIAQFRRAIQVLQEETAAPQNDLSDFIRDAKVSGIEVRLTGTLPEEEQLQRLLIALLREACVNAARHADASVLNVVSETAGNAAVLRITNDGKPPEREIVPRGGLKDLKNRVEKAGGTMELRSQPEFLLTATFPAGGRNEKKEARE